MNFIKIITFLCLPFVLVAQDVQKINTQLLDEFLKSEQHKWNIPDLEVGITNKDSLIYNYGVSKKNYLIGSVSKSFTALAIMQLVEAGKIQLDVSVSNYLYWFTLSDQITVRHLLNQTSGIPKYDGFIEYEYSNKDERMEALKKHLTNINLSNKFIGVKHVYSNLNYTILGELIEEIIKTPYETYIRNNIFKPIGMNESFAGVESSENYGFKQGYQYLYGIPVAVGTKYSSSLISSGGISSNTIDMLKYLRVIIRKGQTKFGNQVIQPSNLNTMLTPFDSRYGMGWSIGKWNGISSKRHSGLNKNYSAMVNILSDGGEYGIIISSNINSFHANRNIMDGIIRILYDQEIKDRFPKELYFRYGLFFLILWITVTFILKLLKWIKRGYPTSIRLNYKVLLRFSLAFTFSIGCLFIIPSLLIKMPVKSLLVLQPDLGYSLLTGTIIGALTSLLKLFITSKKEINY